MLTGTDLDELTAFRRELHRHPELSGQEVGTASMIAAALRDLSPSRILTGLGGHGVAAVFDSGREGPTVLFRAELDGLPIEERNDIAWASLHAGKSHVCGHDGHMAMLLALGRMAARRPVARGRAVLLFQPAEEDGSGALAVIRDPAFAAIRPDWAFAIHVLPGHPFGHVAARAGLINCASMGLRIALSGKTAHAADPGAGLSPARTVASLIPDLEALGRDGPVDEGFRLVTITHARIGEPSFGVAPGEAELYATLRSASDAQLDDLETAARGLAAAAARDAGLGLRFETCDRFAASINDPEAVAVAAAAMGAAGITHGEAGLPMRASEDFGVFGWGAKAAMLCLGPGEDHPALHNPDYDFPDALLPVGSAIFERIMRDLLGHADAPPAGDRPLAPEA
ncbi:amidohydrolase [Profundibacterium mesophilum]|uniref:Cellulose synthesis protein n=1 Tax=Profundibacterium mesophilum KAUST100406-0324 TaxID=1037889 RepID=A0A921NSW8_9RHOB|nr:amidohydrolase [Profundibacterium mesophilum]KAF0675964.1 Cellulose synthesis protein [Profundibacterium mesophilum KAUST100406-0324]